VARDPADAPAHDNPKNVVQSLAKGFRVLEAFTAADPELTLAQVARRAAMDNATAFRLLNTLVMLGYVARIAGTRNFRLRPNASTSASTRLCDGPRERPAGVACSWAR
jgi:hypothetical protein